MLAQYLRTPRLARPANKCKSWNGLAESKMSGTTLARKLKLAPHLSLLRRKAKRLGLQQPEDWIALAVDRGCFHYANGRKAAAISLAELSNEELIALLLSVANRYDPILIRVGAQLLSAPSTNIDFLVKLCQQENALCPLAWIAKAGGESEPNNPFWKELNRELHCVGTRALVFPEAVLPHPSRFRAESGFRRFASSKKIEKRWLRPIPRSS